VLPLAEAHHVDVIFGKQAKARRCLWELGVARQDIGAPPLDVDLLQLA
jgi:hypothetical protein